MKLVLLALLFQVVFTACNKQSSGNGASSYSTERSFRSSGDRPECSDGECLPPDETEEQDCDPAIDPTCPCDPVTDPQCGIIVVDGICAVQAPQYPFLGCDASPVPWYKKKTDADIMQEMQGSLPEKVEVAVLDSGYEYYSQLSPRQAIKSPYADAMKDVAFAMGRVTPRGSRVEATIELDLSNPTNPPIELRGEKPVNGFFDTPSLHGTHVNGMIAGCGNNGISHNLKLNSYRFDLGDICDPTADDLIASIDAICDKESSLPEKEDFKIINVSLGSLEDEVDYDEDGLPSKKFQEAKGRWKAKGCIVVQAAGNSSHMRRYNVSKGVYTAFRSAESQVRNDFARLQEPYYVPRVAIDQFPSIDVISQAVPEEAIDAHLEVGATGQAGQYSQFSSWGEVRAPGSATPIFNNVLSGTSFSAPLVTGIAAEVGATIKSQNKAFWTSLTPPQKVEVVTGIIQKSKFGGVVNGLRAIGLARLAASQSLTSIPKWSSEESQAIMCPKALNDRMEACRATLTNLATGSELDDPQADACIKNAREFVTLCHPKSTLEEENKFGIIKELVEVSIRTEAYGQAIHFMEVFYESLLDAGLDLEQARLQYRKLTPVLFNLVQNRYENRFGERLNLELVLLRHLVIDDSFRPDDITLFLEQLFNGVNFRREMMKRSQRGSEERMQMIVDLIVELSKSQKGAILKALNTTVTTQMQNESLIWLTGPNQYSFQPILRLLDVLSQTNLASDVESLENNLMSKIEAQTSSIPTDQYWKPLAQYKPKLNVVGQPMPWLINVDSDDIYHLDLSYFSGPANRFVESNGLSDHTLINLSWISAMGLTNPQGVFSHEEYRVAKRSYFEAVNWDVFVDKLNEMELPQSEREKKALDYIGDRLILGELFIRPNKARCLQERLGAIMMDALPDSSLINYEIPCEYQRISQVADDLVRTKQRDYRQCLTPDLAALYGLDPRKDGPDKEIYNCQLSGSHTLIPRLFDSIDESQIKPFDRELLNLGMSNLAAGSQMQKTELTAYMESLDEPSLLMSTEFANTFVSNGGPWREQEVLRKRALDQLSVIIAGMSDLTPKSFREMRHGIEIFTRYYDQFASRNEAIPNHQARRNEIFTGLINAQRSLLSNELSVEPVDLAMSFRRLRQSEICKAFGTSAFDMIWETFPLTASKKDAVFMPLVLGQAGSGVGNYRYLYEEARAFARSCWGHVERSQDTLDPGLLCDETSAAADIIFVLDRSGSMQGEIDNVKFWTQQLAAELQERGCASRQGAISYEAFVDENRLYPTSSLEDFTEFMSAVIADGGTEVGLDAIEVALEMLAKSSSPDEHKKKFIVLISDEESVYADNFSSDTGRLLDFWLDKKDRYANTYFTYSVANYGGDLGPFAQANGFGEALSRELGGTPVHHSLEFPLNFDNFVFDFSDYIVTELNR
ncbi:S8 family serine peptidase [Pseudobacteriovorax antillogorgiicola]|uniref:von Willebrand factor type A domain-containing protein n=1 Tax=Pseudobacteriovorax antillogorgiicola TaxID=1513793 RepID=A0A1Y6B9G4_9BACT|nr:S8 family serine peptidase [Pseudobacteriovorax antillogorgiicola]TCS57535.1 von Willebrand factor type A domain-containing protein [Pseudobacteriovorax antillogorgiicola]SME99958.1 von Willebrand factor type A domain-containing protein [Pseudobacteriovorax antillogorgiicola]